MADTNKNTGLKSVYTHYFKEPFEYEDKKYEKITFDFSKLTGYDILAVEEELEAENNTVLVPSWSSAYKCKLAARAAGLPSNIFPAMPAKDFMLICGKANAFLLYGGFIETAPESGSEQKQ